MPTPTLDSILEDRRSQPQQLIEVLQDVQEHYGYITQDPSNLIFININPAVIEIEFSD